MSEVTADTQKMKKKSIIFGSIAGGSLVLAIVLAAISDKIGDVGTYLLFLAGALAVTFIVFIVLFALRLSDYRKLKKGISLDAEDPKLKVKVIVFGVIAIVFFALLVIGFAGLVAKFLDDEPALIMLVLGIINTVIFLVLFINFINKFKRLNK